MTKLIQVERPDGGHCPCYRNKLNWPSKAGLVLIQEWWGITERVKYDADHFGQYQTIVPDLYRGKLASDADEASHLMDQLDFMDAATQDIQGCINQLRADGCEKVGILGYCMGGALTLLAAALATGLDVAVCFYGIPPKEAADLSTIKIPLSCHFAKHDDWCTPAAVDELERTLSSGGVDFELFRYDAQHAFMNPTRPEVYDVQNATWAWERAGNFLDDHLHGKDFLI